MLRAMTTWLEAWRADPRHPRRALPPGEMPGKEVRKLSGLAPDGDALVDYVHERSGAGPSGGGPCAGGGSPHPAWWGLSLDDPLHPRIGWPLLTGFPPGGCGVGPEDRAGAKPRTKRPRARSPVPANLASPATTNVEQHYLRTPEAWLNATQHHPHFLPWHVQKLQEEKMLLLLVSSQ